MGEALLIVFGSFFSFLVLARVLNGPVGNDKGKMLPSWEFWNADHSPGLDGTRGHWITRE